MTLHFNKTCFFGVVLSDKTWRAQDLSFSLPQGTTLATCPPDIIDHLQTLHVPEVMKAFHVGALGREGYKTGGDAIVALPSIDMFCFGLFLFHAVTGSPQGTRAEELGPPASIDQLRRYCRQLPLPQEAMREFDGSYAKEIERRRILSSASLQTAASIRNQALKNAVRSMPPRMREVLLQSAQTALE
ncbi:hypothetical protein GUITHDRAFT_146628 [Guillardia theta CCMP2712]|uniref:Uncharacterized protein n=1 Tax=Guillardia theta (strain CCMP2712) TaxID=905079 RepID=L1IH22_GUITC|nr:hypothetical protein GUITHDRAFT_146628 [Guillardia theta CCMP2712]EKX35219.1 hypothetical protein GUITHDRAFT_146628 [Guillardia theta CCMP2712]|eukprot:XP_005822199.1 hypothetical protein GUITHDRAFT_146628 [Guillardia theta CCMP2712]